MNDHARRHGRYVMKEEITEADVDRMIHAEKLARAKDLMGRIDRSKVGHIHTYKPAGALTDRMIRQEPKL